ncbi:HDOD domain-containing protein [Propionivibrio sp.]|uniref:HDOD domain-containing protein n=1 Tax=Propionivibrio sp. TaxID=2212460 RepID=UPI0025D029C9|nr:HDOD domain-containing protein [Propionivibrio sp.]MBK8743372.1 HDOD domain-containing protein [Propionivibrio sp.]
MVFPPSANMESRFNGLSPLAPTSPGRDIRSKLPLERLPMMPQVLVRLLDLCHRDNVNFSDLAEVIHRDPGMTAKIIAVASSASQYGKNRLVSLDQCLTMLGMGAIKTIVINESVLQVFRRFTMGREFDLRQFWGHSLRCALIARELAKTMGYANREEAYLGGLMHDVGQLAILAADADTYSPLLSAYGDSDELCQHEQESFDLTHAEVGAWLVEKWELDSFLSDGVLYHHDPAERVESAHVLVRIIFLANRLSERHAVAPGPEESDLAGLCGAGNVDLQAMLENVELELIQLARQMGIELIDPPTAEAATPDRLAAEASAGADDLATRLRDVMLVENALGSAASSGSLEAALQAIAQAARVLFSVHPALCFLPQHEDPERFAVHPIGSRWTKASQLEFVRGRSSAEVARAIDHGVLLLVPGTHPQNLLDEQLLRLIGGAGLLLVPLRNQQTCYGIMVAGFENMRQADDYLARSGCFEHFGRMAGALLHSARVTLESEASPGIPAVDALQAQVRRAVHEISNPLSIIQNYLSTLETQFAEGANTAHELGIVKEEINRVSKILQTVLQAPDAVKPEIGAIHLNTLIDDLVALCRASNFAAKNVEILTDLFDNPPAFWSDGDQIKQLLLNLLKNALEAVSAQNAGVVRISTAPWGSSTEPTHIEIRVEDSGPGIPADILDQLYQPVLSTKGQGHLGVGLAVVGELVRKLHGLINCRSNERGTRFQLLLPIGKQ